eukprot:TRINITY_DN68418_c0_g1_i3.p3 TRINITY_DN68418_c0_g1~~TRINITY_DN68418_c0_g1_i3.p3  ORF type:complete len:107 (-),score=4.24 TRINITY_DN68418_c0_g1_i3:389-709(-)
MIKTISTEPVAGFPMRPPARPQQPGEILLGYEIVRHPATCLDCEDMTSGGYLCLCMLAIVFVPFAWIPCVMEEYRQQIQRPVYGPRGSVMGVPKAKVQNNKSTGRR